MKTDIIKNVVPRFSWIPLLTVVIVNCAVYEGARRITQNMGHSTFKTGVDRIIPLISWMICISNVTLKQHVIVDVIAGILVAEFAYFITNKKFFI